MYWEPLRLFRRIRLRGLAERRPLIEHRWTARVAGVHDRLSTTIAHFRNREELLERCSAAGLRGICVENADRRGWRAHGRRHAPALVPAGA
jgi:hypothetical protein